MNTSPKEIYGEYKTAKQFKSQVGDKGIFEQGRINARFYAGDQWRGAGTGNERPLVRHNVIKRIGDFKMSQITDGEITVEYSARGIPRLFSDAPDLRKLEKQLRVKNGGKTPRQPSSEEINLVTAALSNYRKSCAEQNGFSAVCQKALRDAYITGSGIIYTYWDPQKDGGRGDIACETLSINDVYFSDPYIKDIEKQPYIIIASLRRTEDICREAAAFGNAAEQMAIKRDSTDGKAVVLTKLYKEYNPDGSYAVMCTRSTEHAEIRKPFDTKLHKYPIALFCFEERDDIIYGDSEITYLIPNQIAINRMITANVWSAMSTGMPIMVVNGDTVTAEITNDPGQVIKVYGSNEDVKSAVNFVTPPEHAGDFCQSINNLIENTLTQSGATAAVLGDEILNNATALNTVKNSALMSLSIVKNRYTEFIRRVCEIWADFFLTCYGERDLRIEDRDGIWYMPFSSERYKDTAVSAEVRTENAEHHTESEKTEFLLRLFEKGIITKKQLLRRIPSGILERPEELSGAPDSEEDENDGV